MEHLTKVSFKGINVMDTDYINGVVIGYFNLDGRCFEGTWFDGK